MYEVTWPTNLLVSGFSRTNPETSIAKVYGREQASRAKATGESMEEDDIAKSSGVIPWYRDESMKAVQAEELKGGAKA